MSKAKQFSRESLPLTPPIFYILLSLASTDRHGYGIMKQVQLDSENKIKLGPGTLYGAIKRLLDEELIVEVDKESQRRRYYRLTEKGRSILSLELQRYYEAIELAKKKNIFVLPIVKKLVF